MRRRFGILLGIGLYAGLLSLFGCGDEKVTHPTEDSFYSQNNSPDALLKNLQVSWTRKNSEHYADLFANDYLFYFDQDTRFEKSLPEFWNKFQDSTHVCNLFTSNRVADIRINLTYQPTPVPANAVGRENWYRIRVTDAFLEVDLKPEPGQEEGVTLQIDGQQQDFFFRKGQTPADTLPSSPTSGKWYIVQWVDFGRGFYKPGLNPATIPGTWSRIKTVF